VGIAAGFDLVLVLVFVLIGRASHDEAFSLGGTLETLWPFLVGLAIGYLVSRAWRHPFAIVWTGIAIWATTVIGGMLLRWVSGQGVAPSFVIVATIVLGVFLIGWRGVAALVTRAERR
jgi:hypothetical protein